MILTTKNKIIILTAPSGSGKSTIAKSLMKQFPQLRFSVSATTRLPRAGEANGVHYHFLTVEDFQNKINEQAFAEWEKVYEGKYYGTLKSEMETIWNNHQIPLLDIDVKGAINIHKSYPKECFSIFIEVPLELLRERLIARNSETEESLHERLEKAKLEALDKHHFSLIVQNIHLQEAIDACSKAIKQFLEQ